MIRINVGPAQDLKEDNSVYVRVCFSKGAPGLPVRSLGIAKKVTAVVVISSQSRVLLLEGRNLSALGDKVLLEDFVQTTRLFQLLVVVHQEI